MPDADKKLQNLAPRTLRFSAFAEGIQTQIQSQRRRTGVSAPHNPPHTYFTTTNWKLVEAVGAAGDVAFTVML